MLSVVGPNYIFTSARNSAQYYWCPRGLRAVTEQINVVHGTIIVTDVVGE